MVHVFIIIIIIIFVQNEVKRIVFIKPSHTVSFYGYFFTAYRSCVCF